MKLVVVKERPLSASETFIVAHATRLLPGADLIHGQPPERWSERGGVPLVRNTLREKVERVVRTKVLKRSESYTTAVYERVLRRLGADIVLAEYGPTGVLLMDACRHLDLPLVVHFHGFDASREEVLAEYRGDYERLFEQAAALIAVSRPMREALIELGAPPEKVHWNPCGVDVKGIPQADPCHAPPVFLFAGRFVEKKAPHLTFLAFADVHRCVPQARLRMIGDGELFGVCQDLVQALGLDEAVTLLGMQPHERVLEEMQRARVYVQHSVTARSGDSEGTPVAVMEAAAAGLPVVSTWHAGIPDVVEDGETGFLVAERDVHSMARKMRILAEDAEMAAKLGSRGRAAVAREHTMQHRLDGLREILHTCASGAAVGGSKRVGTSMANTRSESWIASLADGVGS